MKHDFVGFQAFPAVDFDAAAFSKRHLLGLDMAHRYPDEIGVFFVDPFDPDQFHIGPALIRGAQRPFGGVGLVDRLDPQFFVGLPCMGSEPSGPFGVIR